MQRLRRVILLDVSAVAGHLAVPAALLLNSYAELCDNRIVIGKKNNMYQGKQLAAGNLLCKQALSPGVCMELCRLSILGLGRCITIH